jgi:hypothetical protein
MFYGYIKRGGGNSSPFDFSETTLKILFCLKIFDNQKTLLPIDLA